MQWGLTYIGETSTDDLAMVLSRLICAVTILFLPIMFVFLCSVFMLRFCLFVDDCVLSRDRP